MSPPEQSEPLLAGEYPPPISQQPTANEQPDSDTKCGWMSLPTTIPADCPPGLECLSALDHLLVHQLVEPLEVLTSIETANEFIVRNNSGEIVFHAWEQSNCCIRNCFGAVRPFEMKILGRYWKEVIILKRPLACHRWFPSCTQSMEVYAPPGSLVGTVKQKLNLGKPSFSINDSSGETVLLIKGPCCLYGLCCSVDFQVLKPDGTFVGKISKEWSGLIEELFTDADNFGISFPMDLDVRMKAVMLGACVLIDSLYFESSYLDNGVITKYWKLHRGF